MCAHRKNESNSIRPSRRERKCESEYVRERGGFNLCQPLFLSFIVMRSSIYVLPLTLTIAKYSKLAHPSFIEEGKSSLS